MGQVEVGLNPVVHAAIAVTEIDLELVEDVEVAGLLGPKSRDLCFVGEYPTLQLVDLLAPVHPASIPTLEHVFDCIGGEGDEKFYESLRRDDWRKVAWGSFDEG